MVDLFEIHFDDAHEFLDYLRPSKKHWGNVGWGKQWLFRGQGNDKWSLTPSAWRDNYTLNLTLYPQDIRKIDKFMSSLTDDKKYQIPHIRKAVELANREFFLIREFVNLADKTGFLLPRLDEWRFLSQDFFRNYTKNIIESPIDNKFWEHPIVALAQHHGVPTRLLDWTENALVASYFALLGHNMLPDFDKKLNSKIVVYAIHELLTGKELKQITVSRAENLNLRMQEGLFLYNIRSDEHFIRTGYFPSIDETLRSIKLEDSEIKNPYQKITLSISENPPYEPQIYVLRNLLERENITTSHLMPTLDNVVKTIKSRFNILSG